MSPPLRAGLSCIHDRLRRSIARVLCCTQLGDDAGSCRFRSVGLGSYLKRILSSCTPLLRRGRFTVLGGLRSGAICASHEKLRFVLKRVIDGTVGCDDSDPVLAVSVVRSRATSILSIRSGNVNMGGCSLPCVFRGNFAKSSASDEGGTANVKLCLIGGVTSSLGLHLRTTSR